VADSRPESTPSTAQSVRAADIVSDHEIRVGLSVSVSGRFQLQGQQALHGILLWQSHANAQGGIPSNGGMSRPVRLIWYDDGSRVSRTRENVLRLIRNDSVDILLGPYSSSLTMAAAEIAEEYKKILWNYGGTSDEIFSHGWRYMIAIASPASDYLRALPQWLVKQYPKRCRICVLYSSQGTFGWQVARGVLESAPETRQSVELVPLDTPLKDSDAALSLLLDISPEAVMLAGEFPGRVGNHANSPALANVGASCSSRGGRNRGFCFSGGAVGRWSARAEPVGTWGELPNDCRTTL